jgi:hypothetical protein
MPSVELGCFASPLFFAVIPAQAGIHFALGAKSKIKMDSRFRGNDVK